MLRATRRQRNPRPIVFDNRRERYILAFHRCDPLCQMAT